MHFLITGHTGFKGSWLTMLLRHHGHTVSGIALDPLPGSLFERSAVAKELASDLRIDIRNSKALGSAIADSGADVVIHLAAQPLVRDSYRDPRYTYETNVVGTLNVLQALELLPTLRAALVVTSDKVYRIDGRHHGYSEADALGGIDPYSASKAMADLLTQSWMRTSPVPIGIARAGNVIGGGDVCRERLLPDLIAACKSGTPVELRHPHAVRPWQHVLDCLAGYLAIIEHMVASGTGGIWNIGPSQDAPMTVSEVATVIAKLWGSSSGWTNAAATDMPETDLLSLDTKRASTLLGWHGQLDTSSALRWTVDWHRESDSARDVTTRQIAAFGALSSDRAY